MSHDCILLLVTRPYYKFGEQNYLHYQLLFCSLFCKKNNQNHMRSYISRMRYVTGSVSNIKYFNFVSLDVCCLDEYLGMSCAMIMNLAP